MSRQNKVVKFHGWWCYLDEYRHKSGARKRDCSNDTFAFLHTSEHVVGSSVDNYLTIGRTGFSWDGATPVLGPAAFFMLRPVDWPVTPTLTRWSVYED